MKKLLSQRFGYIACLAILLATNSCGCGDKITEQPTPQGTPPTLPLVKGYWHTGKPSEILNIKNSPEKTSQPELYKRPYQIYQVRHDGSCGFRSFIPILLQDILVGNKWEKWLQDIHTTIYQPAQNIIQASNLADIQWDVNAANQAEEPIKVQVNIHMGSTQETTKLYQDTEALLQKLGSEAEPRPLQENEIQLLVDFLRKCALMKEIKDCHKNPTTFQKNLGEGLAKLRKEKNETTVSNNFWANDGIFRIFINLYTIMFDGQTPFRDSNSAKTHTIVHYWSNNNRTGYWQDGYNDLKLGTNGRKNQFEKKEDLPQPTIMMYHHDNVYFEYIISHPDQEKGKK